MKSFPYPDGEFRVTSPNRPRWLSTDSQGGIVWTYNYKRATLFNINSYQQMLNDNKWLQDYDLWFQR